MIIRAFRGCPWRKAGDWGVIFTLKRPMIGSDCDNDHHYCHCSVKWLTEKKGTLKKVHWFCPFSATVEIHLKKKWKWYIQDIRHFCVPYMNYNSSLSKNTIFLKLDLREASFWFYPLFSPFMVKTQLSQSDLVYWPETNVPIKSIPWASPSAGMFTHTNVFLFSISSSFFNSFSIHPQPQLFSSPIFSHCLSPCCPISFLYAFLALPPYQPLLFLCCPLSQFHSVHCFPTALVSPQPLFLFLCTQASKMFQSSCRDVLVKTKETR